MTSPWNVRIASPGAGTARPQWKATRPGGHGEGHAGERRDAAAARRRTGRWIRVDVDRLVSWGNHRLPSARYG